MQRCSFTDGIDANPKRAGRCVTSAVAAAPRVAGEANLAEGRQLDAAAAVGHVRAEVPEVQRPAAVARRAALDAHASALTRLQDRPLGERVAAGEAQLVAVQIDDVARDV